jgi:formate dehydrogenase iron-sulfur subunit
MTSANSLYGPLDPAPDAGYTDAPPRVGFFTDTSVCIGCKACEVACKEWNGVPDDGLNLLGMSFDNTGGLTANSWRHVAFIEQPRRLGHEHNHDHGVAAAPFEGTPTGPSGAGDMAAAAARTAQDTGTEPGVKPGIGAGTESGPGSGTESGPGFGTGRQFLGMPSFDLPGTTGREEREERGDFRWLMMSNVCKHCTHAACLDVCPTGALFRTEFGTVVVQQDICNGCGYCIPACPYGVIDQRKDDGRAWKCTLCYDRIGDGLTPACAKACPTQSIQFGELDELRERAARRVEALHESGVGEARLYGNDPNDGVGGDGAFFLLLDEPEVYGLPPDPVVTTRDLPAMWRRAGLVALGMVAATVAAFVGRSGE